MQVRNQGRANGIRESRKPENVKRDENATTKDSNSRESFRPSTSRRTPNLNQTRTSENSSSELTRFLKERKKKRKKGGREAPLYTGVARTASSPLATRPVSSSYKLSPPTPIFPASETLKGKLTT